MTRAKMLAPLLVILALVGLAPVTTGEARTEAEQAEKFIQEFGNRAVTLIASFNEKGAKHEEEFEALMRRSFDLDLIGRFALGNAWRSASPDQQREYQQLFATWVVESNSQRLAAFMSETFNVTGSRAIDDADALVETEIQLPDRAPLEAGWRVREIDGQLKIIDVMVEGVSMALTQRQEFASVVQREGLNGLIRELKTRVGNLKKQQASQG